MVARGRHASCQALWKHGRGSNLNGLTTRVRRINVATNEHPYPVFVGSGHGARTLRRLLRAQRPGGFALVTSRRVWTHVGKALGAAMRKATPIELPDREAAKTWRQVGRLHDVLLARGTRRGAALVAIGGGSVGDTAGFAAATYMRGIDWIGVPTTLLAMVDSAIGGKVGVNHDRAKNLLGAFHQPRAVVADLALLRTLPRRELRGGSHEILKCALIGDASLFAALARGGPADTWSEPLLRRAVLAAIALKAKVVAADEREGGLRAVLNLGHTFGHALEAVTRFARFNHGEAVGHGMVAAAHIARGRGLLGADDFRRLCAAVDALGPRPQVADLDYRAVRTAMASDKKALSSRPTFILPHGIGRVAIRHDVTEAELRAAFVFLKAQ